MTSRTPTVPTLPGQARAESRRSATGVGRRGSVTGVGRNDSKAASIWWAPGRSGLPLGNTLETAIYLEFLYGFGAAPGVDLGCPKAYSKVDTGGHGSVYRQDFQRGFTVANLGAEPARIDLDRPYYTSCEKVVTSLILPGHTAEVLFNATG